MARNTGPDRPEDEYTGEQQEENRREDLADDDRESIWSIPASLKGLYFGLFTTQIVIAAAWLIRTAIVDEALVGIPAKVHFVWQGMAPLAISSAAFALIITDTWKTSMVLGTYLEDVLKKRRQKSIAEAQKKAFAQGQAEGHAQGQAEGHAQGQTEGIMEERQRWQKWNQRREAAVAAGEEFNEPPPSGTERESQDPQREK